MKEKLRMILAVTGIFLLLPLLLTVFLSGREALHIKKQWNMESLLPMLMCREIPWEYEEEMKKVQAVLTRSSLYLRIEEEKMDGEAWGNLWKEAKAAQHQKGYQQAYRSMEAAAKDTEGEMLFYQSKVCEGVFHRISSGTTRDGLEVFGKMEKGYLLSVDSNWDMYGDGYLSGHYFSEGALREQLEKAYPGLVFTEEPVENQINMYKRDKVGHILFLTVGNKTISGEEFRQLLELPSSNFTMQAADGKIRFFVQRTGTRAGTFAVRRKCAGKRGKIVQRDSAILFPGMWSAKKRLLTGRKISVYFCKIREFYR